jgi:uncharacterized protein YciI
VTVHPNDERDSVFVLLPTYQAPLHEVDALLEPHREWLNKHFEAGIFLVAGRREPREGGFILAADGDRAEMERLAATDPFVTAGVARYDLLEVRPTGGLPGVLAALAAHGVAVPTT